MNTVASLTLPAQIIDRFRVVAVERVDRLEAGWNTLMATPDAATIANVQREIHTLKGEARVVGFADVDVICHRFEDLFALARERAFVVSDEFDLAATMALRFIAMLVCKKSGGALAGIDLPGFLDHIEVVLAETRRERSLNQRTPRATFEHDLLDGLAPAARERLAETALAVFLEHHGRANARMAETWRSLRELFVPPEPVAVRALLERHERTTEIARALDKEVAISLDISASFAVAPAIADTIDVAMIHLLRNAIDHGIEPADARALAGKPAIGTVTVRCWLDGETIRFIVRDDGRGIDHARVRERAAALGLLDTSRPATNTELEALLFQPMFSTQTVATTLSGRGVGLDAVATAVARAGGTIAIETHTGRGATFAIEIPYPRRRLRARRLVVPAARVPLAVASDWVAGPTTIGDAIDVVAALELARLPVTDPRDVLSLRRGFEMVRIGACMGDEVDVDRIVITEPTAIAEIVSIDGRDGLLLRPDRL
jgi:two-component system, chemotaxis family, sensor kinase CheA